MLPIGYGFSGADLIYWAILGGCFLLSMLAGGYVKLCFTRGSGPRHSAPASPARR